MAYSPTQRSTPNSMPAHTSATYHASHHALACTECPSVALHSRSHAFVTSSHRLLAANSASVTRHSGHPLLASM